MPKITKSKMEEMIKTGVAYKSSYCYMTEKPDDIGCSECHDYGCCINNGTADPGVSLTGLFDSAKNTLICDLDEIIDG